MARLPRVTTRRPRGPYAKSTARRRQILDAALALYAEAGTRGVSVREIAQRVGMTDAGVLHHFGSREALLTAVLEARDRADAEAYGDVREDPGAALQVIAHNAGTPGLVKLFLDVAAAAAEPGHPAHGYFAERYERYRDGTAAFLKSSAEAPPVPTARATPVDAAWAARMLLAAIDGLQLQWLLNPDIDMAADLAALHRVLATALADRSDDG